MGNYAVTNSFDDMPLFAYVYWVKEKEDGVNLDLYKGINLDRKTNRLTHKRESRHPWMTKLGD